MSRSRTKHPYVSTTCCGDNPGNMKWWKRNCNGKTYTRRVERYSAPDDGKHYWDDPKAYRK